MTSTGTAGAAGTSGGPPEEAVLARLGVLDRFLGDQVSAVAICGAAVCHDHAHATPCPGLVCVTHEAWERMEAAVAGVLRTTLADLCQAGLARRAAGGGAADPALLPAAAPSRAAAGRSAHAAASSGAAPGARQGSGRESGVATPVRGRRTPGARGQSGREPGKGG